MEYKLEIYTPEAHVIAIRDTLNAAGAGVVGDYDSVVSVVNISGFWRPTSNANPVTGQIGEINFGHEVRVDVRCRRDRVKQAMAAVREVHPYEEVVINVIPLANHEFE
ncbi:nitrogen regulatory protein PII [Vibrio sinaloensis DSM 21326]|uniref:Nitrogen regulatory protein PII n=1 Tax=Vibrio sinaloensis DSM 21326 TaxID=945550 RepID=E8MAE0_PHOS4|nr:hypothetical protein [Vibrio sinaloensis]EGA69089.1 nitrogen regulatory protein PII [Vibrio sinaloensis DSM 21326]